MTPYTTLSLTRHHADGATSGIEIVFMRFSWDLFWGRHERGWTVQVGPIEVRRTARPRALTRRALA